MKRSDSANYTCNARNTFGSDTQTVVLSIKGIFLTKFNLNSYKIIISYEWYDKVILI